MGEKLNKEDQAWGADVPQVELLARNVSVHYVVMVVELLIGVVMLPFNVAHLGQSVYGLWVLASSVVMYFSMLDLGYGHALAKFVAECRARRDGATLNQVVSTVFFLFSGIGLLCYGLVAAAAFNLDTFFNLGPEQAATGRDVLLILGVYVALWFPFSVFGGLTYGFQRHYLNGGIALASSVTIALVNVAVLLLGYGLVELVAATTAVRLLTYLGYRLTAYRVFPALQVRPRHFRRARLRELTGFSAYILLIDFANKLNYSADAAVIGAFLNTSAVAVWAVAQRLIETTQAFTGRLTGTLFPVVVDNAATGQTERLRQVLLQGTRVCLALVALVATGLAVLARPLVSVWVGPAFADSVPVIYILAVAVIIRVGNSTATTVLKGAGQHRLLAFANLSAALVNVVLSVVLVRWYGLIGVALGTLIPLALVSTLVLFPAACRRVELPLRQALVGAVWPALWPAAVVAAFLLVTRSLGGPTPVALIIQAAGGGLLYVTVFLGVAIGRSERQWYLGKVKQLLRRSPAGARWQESGGY